MDTKVVAEAMRRLGREKQTGLLEEVLANQELRLQALEAQQQETPSRDSSAPTTGPALKPYELSMDQRQLAQTVSPAETWERIRLAITDCFRSMPSTEAPWATISIDSSTLQLTLRWPTPSGETKAGSPGRVDPSRGDVDGIEGQG